MIEYHLVWCIYEQTKKSRFSFFSLFKNIFINIVIQGVSLWHFIYTYIVPWFGSFPHHSLFSTTFLLKMTSDRFHTCIDDNTLTKFILPYSLHLPSPSHYYRTINNICFTFLSFIVCLFIVQCGFALVFYL
jgi:hypothetical protein